MHTFALCPYISLSAPYKWDIVCIKNKSFLSALDISRSGLFNIAAVHYIWLFIFIFKLIKLN